jgi:oligopeptide/dipeptide ABC transporter ATP-binding protein
MAETVLDVQDAKIYFPVREGLLRKTVAHVKALDGISLSIEAGDTLGLVGESGSGKTTLVNGITMLEHLTEGSVHFRGVDLAKLGKRERKEMRRHIQIVFQDPFWSLNPRWLVRDIVGEPLKAHEKGMRGDRYQDAVAVALEMVGLENNDLYKYPHEFSGGMRQRIAIARALVLEPQLVALDEPTSAVDVLSQYQILLMLQDLKERLGLTFILVSHDLSVVGYLATRIAVMYGGKVMEYGPTADVFARHLHPYTDALLQSVPDPHVDGVDALASLSGEVASALNPPSGCRFHPRCTRAMDICSQQEPPQVKGGEHHYAYCWLLEDSHQRSAMTS